MADVTIQFGPPCSSWTSPYGRDDDQSRGGRVELGDWQLRVGFEDGDRSVPSADWSDSRGGVVLWGQGVEAPEFEAAEFAGRLRDEGARALDAIPGRVAGCAYTCDPPRLTVFRDKMGLVPLFLARDRRGVATSSSAAWLVERQVDSPTIDRRRLAGFLFNSRDHGRNYFFEGLERLRPGECYRRRSGSGEGDFEPYWRPSPDGELSRTEASRELRARLESEVDRFDRRAVVSLSSGLDSAAVAAVRASVRDRPPIAATLDSGRYGELIDEDVFEPLERALSVRSRRFDIDDHLPLSDGSLYTRQLALGPHQHVDEKWLTGFFEWIRSGTGCRQVLVGLGGDRVWRGRRGLAVKRAVSRGDARRVWALRNQMSGQRWLRCVLGELADRCSGEGLAALRRSVRRALDSDRAPWLRSAGWLRPPDGWSGFDRWPRRVGEPETVSRQLARFDRQSWAWEETTLAIERHRRRTGVALDVPLLAPSIWRLGLRVPPSVKFEGGRQKIVLRESVRDLLPDDVVDAPKHGLFDVAVEDAMARRYRHRVVELFDHSRLARLGLLDVEAFVEAFGRYCRGVGSGDGPLYGSLALWRTIAAELWVREVTGET